MPRKTGASFRILLTALIIAPALTVGCKPRQASQPSSTKSVTDREAACIFGQDSNRYGSPGASDIDLGVWQIINSTAIASTVAYSEEADIKRQSQALGFERSAIIKSGSMSAIVLSNKDCVVLAFRGTDMNSLRDWFVDLHVTTDPVKYGRVHEGFHHAWIGLRRDVVDTLKGHGAATKIFWVTGHSLGGALAGLYAYTETFERWLFKGPHIDRVITFGQPLFTDSELSDLMRKEFLGRYFRVVNGIDIVATVPFWLKHFGSLVWFHDDRIEYRPDSPLYGGPGGGVAPAEIPPEIEPTEASLREFIELTHNANAPANGNTYGAVGWPRRISDHFMKGYLDRLKIEIDELSR